MGLTTPRLKICSAAATLVAALLMLCACRFDASSMCRHSSYDHARHRDFVGTLTAGRWCRQQLIRVGFAEARCTVENVLELILGLVYTGQAADGYQRHDACSVVFTVGHHWRRRCVRVSECQPARRRFRRFGPHQRAIRLILPVSHTEARPWTARASFKQGDFLTESNCPEQTAVASERVR